MRSKFKFTSLLLCLMFLAMSVLTGCSLITKDMARYYGATVATVTNKDKNIKIKVTKKDLIQAYNSYGYYYEQYYSKTREEAIKLTLDSLVSRKLTLEDFKKVFPEGFNEKEQTYIWHKTYESLEQVYKSYVDKALGVTDEEEKEEESTDITFKGFEKQARLSKVGDDYKITKTSTTESEIKEFTYTTARDFENSDDRKFIWATFIDYVNKTNVPVYNKAYNNYLKDLKKSEEGQKLSTDTVSIFDREIERIYTTVKENYMIEKYSEHFKNDSDEANISVNQMISLYEGKVKSSYTQYALEKDTSYEENVLSDISKINYFLDGQDDTDFYYVSHILLKFTAAQTTKYKKAATDLANGTITQDDYNNIMSELYGQIVPVVRAKGDDGIYTEVKDSDKLSYEQNPQALLNEIKYQVSQGATDEEKAQIFNEFIYKYNEDPGIMNAQYNYVMGLNSSRAEGASEQELVTLDDGRTYRSYSKMVAEFTKGGAELYNDGMGKVGDMSNLVWTENGIHIMFYAGEVKNTFHGINENFQLGEEAIEKIYNDRLNVCVDKTVFDVLYEELSKDNFAAFENMNINLLKEGCEIVYIKSEYKDLLK